MEELMCFFDCEAIPKKMCTFDRLSTTEPDDCVDCNEICSQYYEKGCKGCPIDEVFTRLAQYEATGLSPKQIEDIDNLYAEKCREVAKLQEIIESSMKVDVNVTLDLNQIPINPKCGGDFNVKKHITG